MAVTVREGETVTVIVQYGVIQDDGSEFRDTVTMSIADYENIWLKQKKGDGDKKKTDRYIAWKAAVDAASQIFTPEPPSAEPLRSNYDDEESFEADWNIWNSQQTEVV